MFSFEAIPERHLIYKSFAFMVLVDIVAPISEPPTESPFYYANLRSGFCNR